MNLTTVAIHWSSSFTVFVDHGDDDDENASSFALLLWFDILLILLHPDNRT